MVSSSQGTGQKVALAFNIHEQFYRIIEMVGFELLRMDGAGQHHPDRYFFMGLFTTTLDSIHSSGDF